MNQISGLAQASFAQMHWTDKLSPILALFFLLQVQIFQDFHIRSIHRDTPQRWKGGSLVDTGKVKPTEQDKQEGCNRVLWGGGACLSLRNRPEDEGWAHRFITAVRGGITKTHACRLNHFHTGVKGGFSPGCDCWRPVCEQDSWRERFEMFSKFPRESRWFAVSPLEFRRCSKNLCSKCSLKAAVESNRVLNPLKFSFWWFLRLQPWNVQV